MGADPFEVLTALDVFLAALSVLTAIAVSQALPSLAGRVAQTEGVALAAWMAVASVCLGAGIWSTDLIAALVLHSPRPGAYAVSPGLQAIALGLLGAGAALALVRLRRPAWLRALAAGLAAGAAFTAMHYVGLDALGAPAPFEADWRILAALAAASALAWAGVLWLAIRFPVDRARHRWLWRAGSGLGVTAALAAMAFTTSTRAGAAVGGSGAAPGEPFVPLAPEGVLGLAGAVLAALSAAMVAAGVDRRVRLKRAETEALRRSEDRFRSLVQASAQIVWTTAPDGQMLGDQASWAEFTGQGPAAYRGWGWFNAIHPEDRERTASLWEETLANRRSLELEHRVRRYDGQYRDCVARVVPVLEPDGRVREWVGTHTDVTDRARMQQERDLLAEAGRMLSSSLDHRETLGAVARLVVPRVADWCAIDVRAEDGSLRRLVAAHQDPYRSALLREIHPDSGGGSQAHGVPRVLETGESELIRSVTAELLEEIAPDPEHARLLAELGIASLLWVPLTARGQVLGVLTLALSGEGESYDLRDLALAEELARRAAVAIDNAGLYSASQSAIRGRDEVLGVVSHDLRNPIGTIVTASDLLLDLELPADEQRRHLEIIRRSAQAANRLIRDLLDVSQSDSGHLSVDLRLADAGRLLAEACEMMRPLAAEKSLRFTCRLPEKLPPIRADRSRIQQVIGNLVGNAIKFVPHGGLVYVTAQHVEGGVRVSVVDTGPGIPSEDLPRLFDRHWRARKTAHLGAGLGLAISRGIVEAHGGRIWAESEPGSGAAFHFIVPAARGAEVEAPEEVPGEPDQPSAPLESAPR